MHRGPPGGRKRAALTYQATASDMARANRPRSGAIDTIAPTEGTPLTTCKLCGANAPLMVSHIMPRWTYRRVTKDGDPNPIMINNSVATRGGPQLKARLLCEDCEQLIGRFDAYASKVSTQTNGSFPALETAKRLDYDPLGLVPADVSHIETSTLAKFGASVLWRTSASAICPPVQLGTRYEYEIATWLRDPNAAPPAHLIILVELLDRSDGLPLDRVCYAPLLVSSSPFHSYRFVCFGIAYHLMVGRMRPPRYEKYCILRNPVALISDGAPMAREIASVMRGIDANGGVRLKKSKS